MLRKLILKEKRREKAIFSTNYDIADKLSYPSPSYMFRFYLKKSFNKVIKLFC